MSDDLATLVGQAADEIEMFELRKRDPLAFRQWI